jgi:Cys-tRNA(Pro)/Cys-tRNA(Cys) deacylase
VAARDQLGGSAARRIEDPRQVLLVQHLSGQDCVMAASPAVDVLVRSGTAHRLHEYIHDVAAPYGQEAAEATGTEPGRVFKTLVVAVADTLAVAVIPVTAELDLKAMAHALGVKKVAMAEPTVAERATGYVVGGISPLGQKRRLPTIVDRSASSWPTVFVSGGRRGLEIELGPADLVALTGASLALVARARKRRSDSADLR